MVSAISKRSNTASSYNNNNNNNSQETPSSTSSAATSSIEQPFFTNPSLIHFNSVQVILCVCVCFFLFSFMTNINQKANSKHGQMFNVLSA